MHLGHPVVVILKAVEPVARGARQAAQSKGLRTLRRARSTTVAKELP